MLYHCTAVQLPATLAACGRLQKWSILDSLIPGDCSDSDSSARGDTVTAAADVASAANVTTAFAI